MGGNAKNLLGQKFGKLTPIKCLGWDGKATRWLCRCDCGKERSVRTYSLTTGDVLTCGCGRAEARKRGRTIPCVVCGKEFWAVPYREKGGQVCCSKECSYIDKGKRFSGKNSPTWKGGKWISHGYVWTKRNGKQVPEHRLILEQAVGRPLRKDEETHHINGNKTDNRPENLTIMSKAEHARLHHALRSSPDQPL
jgi:hypothetical protein